MAEDNNDERMPVLVPGWESSDDECTQSEVEEGLCTGPAEDRDDERMPLLAPGGESSDDECTELDLEEGVCTGAAVDIGCIRCASLELRATPPCIAGPRMMCSDSTLFARRMVDRYVAFLISIQSRFLVKRNEVNKNRTSSCVVTRLGGCIKPGVKFPCSFRNA